VDPPTKLGLVMFIEGMLQPSKTKCFDAVLGPKVRVVSNHLQDELPPVLA